MFLLIPSTLGEIEVTGNLTKSGAGVLDVLATATYFGSTTVAAGTLAVEGTINGSIAVNAGATFACAAGNAGDVTSTGGFAHPGFNISPSPPTWIASLSMRPRPSWCGLAGICLATGRRLQPAQRLRLLPRRGDPLPVGRRRLYPAPGHRSPSSRTSRASPARSTAFPRGLHQPRRGQDLPEPTGGLRLDVVLTFVDDTTTTLTSSANPSTPGQSVTFTATVAPVRVGGPPATGTVTFFDGATTLGTGSLFSGASRPSRRRP